MLIHCTQFVQKFFDKGGRFMEAEMLAVQYLGRALLFLIVGLVLCFLASLGYNTYLKFSKEKVEVLSEKNSNKSNNDE